MQEDGADERLNSEFSQGIENENGSNKLKRHSRGKKVLTKRVVIILLIAVTCVIAFIVCLWILIANLLTDYYLLETIPGPNYHPEDCYGDLVKYSTSKEWSYKRWTNVIEKTIAAYQTTILYSNGGNDTEKKRCAANFPMDFGTYGPCSSALQLQNSYMKGTPCVFIKLNRILDWKPKYYKNVTSLTDSMPHFIKYQLQFGNLKQNILWLSCDGITSVDKENIGPVQYFPKYGFSENAINCSKTYKNLHPMVTVWFERPATGVFIHIECKIWAHNVRYDSEDKGPIGKVEFGLMIDN